MRNIATKTLAMAALAGIIGASAVSAAHAGTFQNGVKAEKQGVEAKKEVHACKGLNSCKGNGGDGKNACKGQGSCATDGSK